MAEAKKPSKKAVLLEEAKKLKLSVTDKNTVVQIEQAIAEAKAAKVTTAKVAELVETEAEIATEEKLTKAGKHSAKGIKEAEAKAAKEARKENAEVVKAEKPKAIIKVRSVLERKGKKFRAASELIDKSKEYTTAQALELAVKTSPVKFDATVELHIKLGVDPRHADQNLRANLVLPAGTGKKVSVAVFCEADDAPVALKAGADIAGNEELLKQLDKGQLNFDVLIATPAMMPKLGKYARILGPKGLMPSPKSGTVTPNVTKAVSEAKAGRVEYRVDTTGIVHLGVGKVSFGADKLNQNVKVVLASIKAAKPASIKGNYVQSIYLTTSMGPSIKVATSEL